MLTFGVSSLQILGVVIFEDLHAVAIYIRQLNREQLLSARETVEV